MAIGWGDWGLRLVDQVTSNADLGSVRDGLVRVPEVDPRYEVAKRRQEARKLRASIPKRREDAAIADVMQQRANTKADSNRFNRAMEFLGAPVRSYEDYSDSNPRKTYNAYFLASELSEDLSKTDPNAIPANLHKYNAGYSGDLDLAAENARAGHFVSRAPFREDLRPDPNHFNPFEPPNLKPVGYEYKGLFNPFVLKSVPSSGPWKTMEWAQRHPIQAANKASQYLPPAFRNAIWGR